MPDRILSDLQIAMLSEDSLNKLNDHGVSTAKELLSLLTSSGSENEVSRYLELRDDELQILLNQLRQLFTSEELHSIESVTTIPQSLGCLEDDDELRSNEDPQDPGERT